jgi:F0F1-type ATP synthase membrane subunit c/vacuolar-type H+-ATPase subunit K
MPAKKTFLTLAALGLIFSAATSAHAQEEGSFTIATTYEVLEETQNGDIVSFSTDKKGLVLSREAYDKRLFAVVATDPQIVYRTGEGTQPMVRDGIANVNATTINGDIAAGDYITSSPVPGKAQKATSSTGHILGVAISDLREGDGEAVEHEGQKVTTGKIRVALAIGPVSPALFLLKSSSGAVGALDQIGNALMQTFQEPESGFVIIRYILAAAVVLLATVVSFRNFGRNITQGIEALGRNPLARREIEMMIIFNIILIAVASIVSVLFSLAIIRF